MSAFLGTFVTVKTMADGTPRVTFDLQCTLAEFAALGTVPGTPFGLARITQEAAIAGAQAEAVKEPKEKPKHKMALSGYAAMFCEMPEFWKFLIEKFPPYAVENKDQAAQCVREVCGVRSRSEFDSSHEEGDRFRRLIAAPWSISLLNPRKIES